MATELWQEILFTFTVGMPARPKTLWRTIRSYFPIIATDIVVGVTIQIYDNSNNAKRPRLLRSPTSRITTLLWQPGTHASPYSLYSVTHTVTVYAISNVTTLAYIKLRLSSQ